MACLSLRSTPLLATIQHAGVTGVLGPSGIGQESRYENLVRPEGFNRRLPSAEPGSTPAQTCPHADVSTTAQELDSCAVWKSEYRLDTRPGVTG